MIYLFVFIIGFILGMLFIDILKNIRKFIYKRSQRLKREAFKKRMDDLMQ